MMDFSGGAGLNRGLGISNSGSFSVATPKHVQLQSNNASLVGALMSPSPANTTNPPPMPTTTSTISQSTSPEALEMAGRTVEKLMHTDSQFPNLAEKLKTGHYVSLSGLQESDYPASSKSNGPSLGGANPASSVLTSGTPGGPIGIGNAPENASLKQITSSKKIPLPAELVENFSHMQCNCMMGLFPEISRSWLTIDSDLYVWKFEDGTDLAYFDGLSYAILSVGLLQPKKNIFLPHIKYILCLTTAVEIVLLGVSFTKQEDDEYGEMHLIPEPLFTLPTDSTFMMCVAGSTTTGRIFLGGKDGCLYEFFYKAEDGWFGKKAQKINHSTSALSFLVPGFINSALYEEDSLEQIIVDDTRNILYTRSEKGTIQVYDLGQDGMQMNKVAQINQDTISQEAAKAVLNIDKANFSPIVGISVLPVSESENLSLVAISANGVRFYFSTTMQGSTDQRAHNLLLKHVRLPPGFSATAIVPKPNSVHMCYYKHGTLLLASSQNTNTGLLWVMSSDAFPFQSVLMETHSTVPLDGRIWAMDEIPQSKKMLSLYKDSFSNQEPPLAVIQHTQRPRKFVLISAHGTYVVSNLRPVDHLRHLLIENGGPENDVIKAFFNMHAGPQAIATCLLLACSQTIQDSQVSQWATRAFFLYGGEPQLIFPHAGHHFPRTPVTGAASPVAPFHPHVTSTPHIWPMQNMDVSQNMAGSSVPEVNYSNKHNGIYLYFSRVIRPVWLATLVIPGKKDDPLTSTVSSDEVDWILAQLNDLKSFLERNSQFSSNVPAASAAGNLAVGNDFHQKSQQEALLRERQSLLFLQQLVHHCLQVLGLWKVICDHQFHVVASSLSSDDQNVLRGMYFRDLMISVSGRDLCNRLVQSVIQLYLNDNASTDAISNRLREICPSLYRNEDAISSKAHEMLISARQSQHTPQAREKLLNEAVTMCKEIAARANLDVLCSHLGAVHCYTGIVDLCLAAAEKRDPQGVALHFYKNDEPPEDQQGLQAFITRMSCYKHILEMLRRLLETCTSYPQSPNIPYAPGPPPKPDPNSLPPKEAGEYAKQVLDAALSSGDHLFHVALYQWLMSQGEFDRLLSVRSPFIEDFLIRGTRRSADSIVSFDLLWKYYEKTRSYAAAAKILARLADQQSSEVNLNQRLEYLSRAIMCVKSGEVGGESSRAQVGQLLHELEEKMEVARVQLKIVESLSNKHSTEGGSEISAALTKLNCELFDISQLYQSYAEPFDLWECQLAILHCSGHNDPMLVETMWKNIIDSELKKSETSNGNTRVVLMSNKIKYLGKFYARSQKYFPLDFIVRRLEIFSCEIKADHQWVFKTLLEVGLDFPRLLDNYNKIYVTNDPVWLKLGSPNHLLYVLAKLIDAYAESPSSVNYNERRQFTVICLDAIGQYLGTLYTKHDSNLLVQEFRSIQSKLERL